MNIVDAVLKAVRDHEYYPAPCACMGPQPGQQHCPCVLNIKAARFKQYEAVAMVFCRHSIVRSIALRGHRSDV